jgi:hypothetical protein
MKVNEYLPNLDVEAPAWLDALEPFYRPWQMAYFRPFSNVISINGKIPPIWRTDVDDVIAWRHCKSSIPSLSALERKTYASPVMNITVKIVFGIPLCNLYLFCQCISAFGWFRRRRRTHCKRQLALSFFWTQPSQGNSPFCIEATCIILLFFFRIVCVSGVWESWFRHVTIRRTPRTNICL